jgi:hypothetical protein
MLDAHISGSKVGGALGELGHDVKATEKIECIPDEALLKVAAEEGRVLVTHNVKDFARILRQRPPEKSHSGLILIPRSVKLNDFGTMISGIQRTLRRLSQEDWVDRVEWMRSAKSS